MTEQKTIVHECKTYDVKKIYSLLDDRMFDLISPADCVVLKPNWVKESHIHNQNEWESIITHPTIITAVLLKVLERLDASGKIIITDGPQTDSSFSKIISKYPVDLWMKKAKQKKVNLEIIDLRDDEWVNKGDVNIKRIKLPGDPRGKVKLNLEGNKSEFFNHKKSIRGYYGADYNIKETNSAHDGVDNIYSVSRSVLEADVFINLPKLKTHKKSGITCCLKNLVGINTYKNYLPHYSEGSPNDNGDQFPYDNINAKIEGPLMAFIKQHLIQNIWIARLFKPIKKIGKRVFGDTDEVIRSGNWAGNNTIWRMILDLNKILFYATPLGKFHGDKLKNKKKYIGIVDAILAGEGNGPMAPDPVKMNKIILGTNPVAIDATCAVLMGLNPQKIPSINEAFSIKKFPLCDFQFSDIEIEMGTEKHHLFKSSLNKYIIPFKPHFGWKELIEE